MRILVDTSVWIDFFNGFASSEAEALARYLRSDADLLTCGLVMAEVLQGLREPDSVQTLEKHFRDMELLVPREPDSYVEAAALHRQLRRQGVTVRSTIDCLIVQLAAEHDALILHKDRDLRQILDSGISKVRVAPFLDG